jgi:hypothetical protein
MINVEIVSRINRHKLSLRNIINLEFDLIHELM